MILEYRNVNEFLMEINCPISIVNRPVVKADFEEASCCDNVEVSPFIVLPNHMFISSKDGHVVISAFKVEKSIWLSSWTSSANKLPYNVLLKGRKEYLFVNKLKKIRVKILIEGLDVIVHKRDESRIDVTDKPT